ncbi:hypothetical protein [Planktomarina temperata]|jgi:hypothetical protein|uniref:hypothetical protein n=1 Tax=Planktomarina temperata TaxID=1284658 RepID=UPI0023B49BBC
MPAKRPATFLLTPQYRVDALWLNGAGPEVKTEAPPPAEAPNEAPAPFVDLHGLEGLLRKPDPKIILSLPEDAELIDQLHKLTGKMPKFAQFNPPPTASTATPPEPPPPLKAETAKEQSAPHANPPAAAATMDLSDLTSGRRRKHAAAE